MGFYSGTITGGGPAALIAKIEECLALESTYWEYVEEATVATKTYRVWKNKGHAWNSDVPFYFYVTSVSTGIYIRPFEAWDSGAKKCTGLVSTAASGSITLDSLGRLSATDPMQTSSAALYINGIPAATTTYTYYIGVGPQGFFITTSLGTDGGYVGLFEPSGVHSSGEFPLISVPQDISASPRFSRAPGLTGSVSYSTVNATLTADAAYGAIPTGVAQLGGKSVLARRRVNEGSIYRGHLPSWVLVSAVPAAGVAAGDTITIGGVTYTYCKNGSYNWVCA